MGDGVCDDLNNNEMCGFDGGDCCDYMPGWNARCKDCRCKEECKDGKYGTSTDWCAQNIVSKNSCDATGCTSGGVSMPCGQVCKRGCKKCDEGTCKDVGSIFGKGNDFVHRLRIMDCVIRQMPHVVKSPVEIFVEKPVT